jgi:hypothetical protein
MTITGQRIMLFFLSFGLTNHKDRSMKRLTALFLLLVCTDLFAQKAIEISEGASNFSTGSQNALSFIIQNGDTKSVGKDWEKELKSWKCKPKGKDELVAEECSHKSMGDRSFFVYSKVEDVPNEGVRITAAFDLGGAYMTSKDHPDRFLAAKKLLYDFAVAETKEVVKGEIKLAEKLLSDRQSELSSLEKNQQQQEGAIQDYEKKIEEAKAAIVRLKEEQVAKKGEIAAQEGVVKGLNDKLQAVK